MFVKNIQKIIDIISKSLNAQDNKDWTLSEENKNIIEVKFVCQDSSIIQIHIQINNRDMELVLQTEDFKKNLSIDKFISNFEYYLEQEFLNNIKIKTVNNGNFVTLLITD